MYDELIVRGQLPRPQRKTVIALDNLFQPRIGQFSITDKDAKAACIQIVTMPAGNVVDYARNSEGVTGPAPQPAVERQPGRRGAIHIGEFIGFDIAICPAGAPENANVLPELLLDVH